MWAFLLGLSLLQAAGCTAAEYRQFDFWIGEWDVFADGKTLAGTNSITRAMDGCVIREEWRSARGTTGSSLNTYNPVTRRWHQTWTDSSGLLLQIEGEFRDGAMQLTGPGFSPQGRTFNRITWRAEGAGVRQVWEISPDEGRSWKPLFDGTYRRR